MDRVRTFCQFQVLAVVVAFFGFAALFTPDKSKIALYEMLRAVYVKMPDGRMRYPFKEMEER